MPLLCLSLVGCQTRTITNGREFDGSKIAKIDKGITTTDELIALLGKPNKQWVWSDDGVMWEYSWSKEAVKTEFNWAGQELITDGYKRTLQVLIKYDRVVNYTYYEGPYHIENKPGSN
jgi:hypothetical protein